ncbi:MAG: transcriptional regulator [Desulfobulbus propionicus]|nr:MAG: transcriptional regulator [Desulfobulbus propionicus]
MEFKVIIASVKQEYTDQVVDAAKNAGATGATIIHARGTGIREAKTFFGLSLEAQTDIILFLTERHCVAPILEAINTAGEFHKPGTGIAFVLPVEQVIGLETQLKKLQESIDQGEQQG